MTSQNEGLRKVMGGSWEVELLPSEVLFFPDGNEPIVLSADDFDRFMAECKKKSQPSEYLSKGADLYRERIEKLNALINGDVKQ